MLHQARRRAALWHHADPASARLAGPARSDHAQLMTLLDGVGRRRGPPDLTAFTAMDGGAPSEEQHQQSAALSASAVTCSPRPDAQQDSVRLRRATSAAFPGSYSPSRLSVGSTGALGFVRHSAVESCCHLSSAPTAVHGHLAPIRHTASVHDLGNHRAASLPTAVLRSPGKPPHHQPLRSPFGNASEGSGACQRVHSDV